MNEERLRSTDPEARDDVEALAEVTLAIYEGEFHDTFYEHGEWFIRITLSEGCEPDEMTFKVVDCESPNGMSYLDVEEV